MGTVTRITHVASVEEADRERTQLLLAADGCATRTLVTWLDDAGVQAPGLARVAVDAA
jgi:uncharacterized metal-binding protein